MGGGPCLQGTALSGCCGTAVSGSRKIAAGPTVARDSLGTGERCPWLAQHCRGRRAWAAVLLLSLHANAPALQATPILMLHIPRSVEGCGGPTWGAGGCAGGAAGGCTEGAGTAMLLAASTSFISSGRQGLQECQLNASFLQAACHVRTPAGDQHRAAGNLTLLHRHV